MRFLWKYFDKNQAAIQALKDYPLMQTLATQTPAQTRQAALDSLQAQRNNQAQGSRPKHSIPDPTGNQASALTDEYAFMQERHQDAQDYMTWFTPAWAQLTSQEQDTLAAIYLNECSIQQLQDQLGIGKTSIYQIKTKATQRLAQALYG